MAARHGLGPPMLVVAPFLIAPGDARRSKQNVAGAIHPCYIRLRCFFINWRAPIHFANFTAFTAFLATSADSIETICLSRATAFMRLHHIIARYNTDIQLNVFAIVVVTTMCFVGGGFLVFPIQIFARFFAIEGSRDPTEAVIIDKQTISTKPSIMRFDLRRVNCSG